MKLAIFDIDGTLVEGSTERRFWRYLLKRGHQGPRQVLAYLLFWLRYFPVYRSQTAKNNKAYLYKLDTARVRALAERFVAEEILPRLYAPAVQRLQSHLRCGDTVVLLSGTLEPIARPLAKALGVEHVYATACRERDGRYLAGPPKVHPFGAAKLAIAAGFAREIGAPTCGKQARTATRATTSRCSRPSAIPWRCSRIGPCWKRRAATAG